MVPNNQGSYIEHDYVQTQQSDLAMCHATKGVLTTFRVSAMKECIEHYNGHLSGPSQLGFILILYICNSFEMTEVPPK